MNIYIFNCILFPVSMSARLHANEIILIHKHGFRDNVFSFVGPNGKSEALKSSENIIPSPHSTNLAVELQTVYTHDQL